MTSCHVVVHVFNGSLFNHVTEQLANLQRPYVLTVSYSGDDATWCARMRQLHPPHHFVRVSNRGRDFGALTQLVLAGHLRSGLPVLKLHTKESKHRQDGLQWGRALLHGMLPNPSSAERALEQVSVTHERRLLAPQSAWQTCDDSDPNFARVEELLSSIGRPIPAKFRYPAGSMFWASPALMHDLVNLLRSLSLRAFPREAGQQDFTIAHACERLVGALADDLGGAGIPS